MRTQDWRNHPRILEVGLEYPRHLNDPHNDYPLAREKMLMNN